MADPEPPSSSGGGMNKKLAGIPMYLWFGIAGGAAAIGWWWYKNRQSQNAQSSQTAGAAQTSATSTADTSGIATDQYESLLAQLRDLQSQQGTDISIDQDIDKDVDNPGPVPMPGGSPTGPPTRPKPPTPTPTPTPTSPKGRTVTVGKFPAWNSTLWGIAQREYGSGSQYPKIYNANKALILSEEQKHGMTSAQAQTRKWLYPGERLMIP